MGRSNPAGLVSVDPRVELMSVIFMIAGNAEYNQADDEYASVVREAFAPFEGHEVIKVARHLRGTGPGMSCDGPMSLAVHLVDVARLEPRGRFEPAPVTLDDRWADTGRREPFLTAARDFVAVTDFTGFFASNGPVYERVLAPVRAAVPGAEHFTWLDAFYGVSAQGHFSLVIGMLKGTDANGPRAVIDGVEHRYSIVGRGMIDERRFPRWRENLVSLMIHEFGHSYGNPLVGRYVDQLEPAGRRIFAKVAEQMKAQAYGTWRTVMCESVVRACDVRYLMAHHDATIVDRSIQRDRDRGFLWLDALVALLDDYEGDRDQYPTLDRFFGHIIRFFNDWARRHC